MQTFLPYRDFKKSAAVLDYRRLGKQRVETYQVLKTLKLPTREKQGWVNHPVARMWKGYDLALLEYQIAVCKEWTDSRGYKDTCLEKSMDLFTPEELKAFEKGDYPYPEWIDNELLHLSHRSNLLRKDSDFYKDKFESSLGDEMEYVWPV